MLFGDRWCRTSCNNSNCRCYISGNTIFVGWGEGSEFGLLREIRGVGAGISVIGCGFQLLRGIRGVCAGIFVIG